ncbi:glycoside hydrolase family 26 protein [Flavobacterium sp. TMP13]|uniref:glycoside hydrolase family 26 protein n=1 Tax=Flavobacterium sp. TMP13 TaxID=3425950 RepID=UPI003D782BE7
MKNKILLSFTAIALSTITNSQVNPKATQKVKNLYGNLKEIAWDSKEVLFGQEFFNSYRWPENNFDDPNVSDVKTVTGQHPAVLGQDFDYYNQKTAEEVERHTKAVKRAYELGCVITFDYHMHSKNHASTLFEESDKLLMYNIGEQNDSNGEVTWLKAELDKAIKIINDLNMPIVFRPFHEMNGNWFWWGSKADGGAESYIKMYQFTVDYVNARTNNVLWEWSPNLPFTEKYYPGDKYVDVVGVDMYDQGNEGYRSFDDMVSQLEEMSDFSLKHDKIPVFSEVGNRITSPDQKPNWWSDIDEKIQASDRAFKIAWMLTWINQPWGNPPYVAHGASSEEAKKGLNNFVNSSTILMQPEAAKRNMYDQSKWTTAKSNALKKDSK